MDTWTDVFTDSHGVRRCKRCQHARPTSKQDIGQVASNTLESMLKNIQKATEAIKK
jgi:hypothetical protein